MCILTKYMKEYKQLAWILLWYNTNVGQPDRVSSDHLAKNRHISVRKPTEYQQPRWCLNHPLASYLIPASISASLSLTSLSLYSLDLFFSLGWTVLCAYVEWNAAECNAAAEAIYTVQRRWSGAKISKLVSCRLTRGGQRFVADVLEESKTN
jgi:hypothetical protein